MYYLLNRASYGIRIEIRQYIKVCDLRQSGALPPVFSNIFFSCKNNIHSIRNNWYYSNIKLIFQGLFR